MAFDAAAYHDQLDLTLMFVGNPAFLQSAGWIQNMSGHDLVYKNSGEVLVGILVAKISEFRLQCGPSGNFRTDSSFQREFKKAKFQFNAGVPDDPILEPAFNSAISNLVKLQKTRSVTGVNKNLLDNNANSFSIRFGANIFEKRVCISFEMFLPIKLFANLELAIRRSRFHRLLVRLGKRRHYTSST